MDPLVVCFESAVDFCAVDFCTVDFCPDDLCIGDFCAADFGVVDFSAFECSDFGFLAAGLSALCAGLSGRCDSGFLRARLRDDDTLDLDSWRSTGRSVAFLKVLTWSAVNWRYSPAGKSAGSLISPKATRMSRTTRRLKCSNNRLTKRFLPS